MAQYRAEILAIFASYFGISNDFINSFWNLLTFSESLSLQAWLWFKKCACHPRTIYRDMIQFQQFPLFWIIIWIVIDLLTWSNKKNLLITGKSLSEAPIFASTNPQYDDRLFMKIVSSEYLCTQIVVFGLFWHSEQSWYTTCSADVASFWKRFTCTKQFKYSVISIKRTGSLNYFKCLI